MTEVGVGEGFFSKLGKVFGARSEGKEVSTGERPEVIKAAPEEALNDLEGITRVTSDNRAVYLLVGGDYYSFESLPYSDSLTLVGDLKKSKSVAVITGRKNTKGHLDVIGKKLKSLKMREDIDLIHEINFRKRGEESSFLQGLTDLSQEVVSRRQAVRVS